MRLGRRNGAPVLVMNKLLRENESNNTGFFCTVRSKLVNSEIITACAHIAREEASINGATYEEWNTGKEVANKQ